MEEIKEKKNKEKRTDVIVSFICGIIVGVVGVFVVVLLSISYDDMNSDKTSFNNLIENHNTYFEENISEEKLGKHIMTGDWDKKEVVLTIKRTQLNYDIASDVDKDLDLQNVNRYYCDNLMESIIENFNESGLEDKNISYFVIITDMNDKEIVRYSY